MSKPGPALGFYLKHGGDAFALAEMKSPPRGVSQEDWDKLNTVVAMARDEVAEFLRACCERVVAALGDAIILVGRAPSQSSRKQNWDAWREFRAPGTGKDVGIGYLGVMLDVRFDGHGSVLGYLRPKKRDAGVCLRDATKAASPTEDQLTFLVPETAVVVQHVITAETDLDGAMTACEESFVRIRPGLEAFLSGIGSPEGGEGPS